MSLTEKQWQYLERDWAEGGDTIKDMIDEKELAWTAIELKHHVEKMQKLWRDSHGVAVGQHPPEYVNAIIETIKLNKKIQVLKDTINIIICELNRLADIVGNDDVILIEKVIEMAEKVLSE